MLHGGSQSNKCHLCWRYLRIKGVVSSLLLLLFCGFIFLQFDSTQDSRREFERSVFITQHGQHYNSKVDSLVSTELSHMNDAVYLDYTGSGVYQMKQLRQAFDLLSSRFFSNSHSDSPSSILTDQVVQHARALVLSFFGTTEAEYSVVFTGGTTAALKMIAENFPWSDKSTFLYLRQNHLSVLGMRDVAVQHGASFRVVDEVELNCHSNKAHPLQSISSDATFHLFAYPAMDNFAGVKYPLHWTDDFRDPICGAKYLNKSGSNGSSLSDSWLTLLDAAAFVPTHKLDLSKHDPDFVTLSFYKMFGYPTGLGALLVKQSIVHLLNKVYFGGGSAHFTLSETQYTVFDPNPCKKFEDGSLNFLSIAALQFGFAELAEFGMLSISQHVTSLAKYAYSVLSRMRHSNGQLLATIYGKHGVLGGNLQGGILTFSLMNEHGQPMLFTRFQHQASQRGFHIRTGCMCNPGACYHYLGIGWREIKEYAERNTTTCTAEVDIINGKPLGAIRISFGYLTTFDDVSSFLHFLGDTCLS